MKEGLLLSEANGGDLQSYIKEHDDEIDNALRKKWGYWVAQVFAHAHKNDVVHSNISTTNVLVYQTSQSTNVLFADIGGSRCVELNLDSGLLPGDPFSDPCYPRSTDYESPKIDVFSLGVVIYVMMTSQYPFCNGPALQGKKIFVYGDRVRAIFEKECSRTCPVCRWGISSQDAAASVCSILRRRLLKQLKKKRASKVYVVLVKDGVWGCAGFI
ncbi:hypothetical protein EJ02DRAFT_219888 [Clathrospora elynae]|uniref:non-specific serine/threonine protein kinase n=1 Tax=Clathrospora elynae TaxID=706981 RepID=A0A6A5SJN5_9PLEO|nr:hypothetical protein EJ02DRAFT_219888 [Clathrospora elynae]